MAKAGSGKKFEGVLMSYKELGSNLLHDTINKLRHAEGLDLAAMARINLVYKALVKRLDEMSEKYVQLIDKPFRAKLKEAGIEWEDGQNPPDLDDEQTKKFTELKEENDKAIAEFEKLTTIVNCIPLGPQHVKDLKTLSPARLDALGGLFDADGSVREKALRGKLGVVK